MLRQLPVGPLAAARYSPALLDNCAAQSVHGVRGMEKNISEEIPAGIDRLRRLRIPALQRIHRELFGADCTVRHVQYLRRKLAWELQARAEGRLPEESRQHALGIAWQTILRTRAHSQSRPSVPCTVSFGHDTRLPPPGTLLRRAFKGKSVTVKVLSAGFEHEGRIFGSLTAIANKVTGGKWNGFVFFGLARNARHGR